MSVEAITCYTIQCDGCKTILGDGVDVIYHAESNSEIRLWAEESDWIIEEDKVRCGTCREIGEEKEEEENEQE